MPPGAIWLMIFRVVQGIGAACLIGNSAAILTDAFPVNQRGLALGINNIAGISGVFIGLVLGGSARTDQLAAGVSRLGPVRPLRHGMGVPQAARSAGVRRRVPIDWLGNLTFAIGLILVMIGITYGIEPYKSDPMGWTSPLVLSSLVLGAAFLTGFALVESRVENPMFRLGLFRIRAFTFGTLSSFLAAVGPRWTHVHADHLAAGNLVTRARIQLHVDATLGRHLHDSVDGGLPARRAALRLSVGSTRLTPVRDRRDDRRCRQLRCSCNCCRSISRISCSP